MFKDAKFVAGPKTKIRMPAISVRLDKKLRAKVNAAAQRHNISTNEMVRQLLLMFLQQRHPKLYDAYIEEMKE